jgi:hypothetical protein
VEVSARKRTFAGTVLDCHLFSLKDDEALEYRSNSCTHFSAFTAARKLVGNLAVRIADIFLDSFPNLDELLLKAKSSGLHRHKSSDYISRIRIPKNSENTSEYFQILPNFNSFTR